MVETEGLPLQAPTFVSLRDLRLEVPPRVCDCVPNALRIARAPTQPAVLDPCPEPVEHPPHAEEELLPVPAKPLWAEERIFGRVAIPYAAQVVSALMLETGLQGDVAAVVSRELGQHPPVEPARDALELAAGRIGRGRKNARLARKAGIERRVHAHGLRHAFAVDLVRGGAPLYVVRDALGHASVATTQVYLSRVGAHEAVEAMRNRPWSPE
jgi:hypothetical protein